MHGERQKEEVFTVPLESPDKAVVLDFNGPGKEASHSFYEPMSSSISPSADSGYVTVIIPPWAW